MLKSSISPHAEKVGRIMKTDGGAHPPEFWAQVTAEHIAPISDDMTGQRRFAALALQGKIAAALEPHHTKVQADEATKLKADSAHAHNPPNPEEYLDEALQALQDAAKGTEWEAHLTFGKTKPAWLAAHEADVAAMGGDAKPLTPEQQSDLASWKRQQLIRQEIGTHFATAQHIAKSWHRDSMKGAN